MEEISLDMVRDHMDHLLFVELIFRIPTLTFRCTPLFKM